MIRSTLTFARGLLPLALAAVWLAATAAAQQEAQPFRRAGRGPGAMGEGQGRGFGPGGGRRAGPGAQVMTLGRLLQIDAQLVRLSDEFERLERRQAQILDELARQRERYRPGALDPASLLARQSIEALMSEAHQLTEQTRAAEETAGALLTDAAATRDLWAPLLERDSPLPGLDDAASSATRARWLRAAHALDRDGPRGFAVALLGELLGQAAVRAMNQPAATAGPFPVGPPNDATGPMGSPELRGRGGRALRDQLSDRLARLEERNADLMRQVEQQQREIEWLRSLISTIAPGPGRRMPTDAPTRLDQPASDPSPLRER